MNGGFIVVILKKYSDMPEIKSYLSVRIVTISLLLLSGLVSACDDLFSSDNNLEDGNQAVFLFIDEDSIDNGNEPNNFSEQDVNDPLATLGLRTTLKYFKDNVDEEINLNTGAVGDEGWYAIGSIQASWKSAGPTTNGLTNYLVPGPGLGATIPDDNREVLLDKVPDVMPLRATGLKMLEGKTIYAVVYDNDIGMNYSPISANLMGANLGIVSFEVVEVKKRTDGSDGSLPVVTIRIRKVEEVASMPLGLFSNAPVPESSSEPFDVTPPATSTKAIIKLDY
jgi:hypothetical protein